jgi:hypothetical protein
VLVLSSLRAVILFLLRWIPDPNAKNSQEELKKHALRQSRKRERPKGRHKAVIASGSIRKITDNLDTPSDSLL